MGAVKVDIYGKEEKFSNKEYSDNCKEDIYHLLFNIALIYEEKKKGNVQAFALFEDFYKYIKNYDYLHEFVLVETGQVKNNPNSNIFECVSEKFHKTEVKAKQQIDREIDLLLKEKGEDWLEWIDSVYHSRLKPKKETCLYKSNIPDSSYWEADFKLKNRFTPFWSDENNIPKELQELIDDRNVILDKIKKLPSCKRKNELISLSKGYVDDIIDMKRYHNIPINFKTKSMKIKLVELYNEEYFEDESAIECKKDLCSLDYIDYIAEEKLTDTQYMIYQLYFKFDYTYKKIGDILSISKQGVNNHIVAITKKIQKYA